MTSTVIDIAACLSRLQAANADPDDLNGFFKTVDTAYDMNPIEDAGDLPAVFLYPGYVDSNPLGDGAVRQKLYHTLIVDVLCSVNDLRTAVSHLREVFLGWEMDPNHGPFALAFTGHLAGQACGPIDLKGGVIHWQERYQNSTHTKLIHN